MRWLKIIFVVMLLAASSVTLSATEGTDDKEVDVAHMLFGHIGDSYGWHITDWSGKHVTIPLPCIVYSRHSGWHVFMSTKIEHGHQYQGFFLAPTVTASALKGAIFAANIYEKFQKNRSDNGWFRGNRKSNRFCRSGKSVCCCRS